MISHVGEGIKPHVRKLFKYVKDYLKNPKIGLGIEVVEDGVTKILQDGEPTGFFITAGDFMARNLKGERYPFGVRSAEVYGSFSLGKTPTTKLLKAAKKGMRVVAIGGYTGIEGSMKDNISFHKGVLSTVKERLGVRVLDKLIKKHGYSKEEQLNNDSQKSLSGILADANKIIKERNDSGTGKPLKRIIKKDIALNFVEPDVLNLLGRINYIGILKEVRTGDARNYKHDIYVTEPIFEKIIELENKPYLRDLIAELPDATFNKGLSRKEWGKAISQGDLTVARGDSPLGDLLLKAAIEGGTGFKRNIEAPVQIYSESLKKRNITEAIEDLSSERGFRLRKASVELDGALGLQNLSRETIHINGEVGNGVVTEYIHTPETATALKLKGAMLSLLGKQPDVTTFIGKDKGNHSLYKLTTINKDVKGIAEALNTVGVKDFIITRRGLETDVTIKDYGEVNIDAVNNLAKILDANYSKAEGEFVELFGTNNQKHLKGKKQGEFFNEKEKSRFAHERAIEIIASQPEGWKIAKKIFTKNLSDFTGGKKVEIKRADELLNDIKLKRKTLSKAEGDKLAHGIETEGGRALDRLIEGGSMGTKNFYGRETSNYSRKQKFEDATKVAVAVLHKGAKNFQVFAKEMISKLGKSVKPLLNKLYGEAKKYLKNPKIGLGIEVVDKDGTPINKNKIGEDVTIWGDRYTETGEPLPKSELIKKKKKLNGAIHITEAGLKSNKIATDADFKRMKKELFGETTLKNILNSSDASSYLQMKAYHELLGRYSNRAVTVKLGGKEVTLSDLTRTPKVEEVPDPLSVVTKEMGVDIPEGSKVDISRSELTDVDLIADANMSKPRKTPKVPGSPTGKGAWVTIKRFLRNISSTEDWMSHIQQQHGVKTFDVWERIRQGQAQFEAKRGEWTGKLQNALEPFGKTKNWNDWFPQEDRMRVHEALVGKIDPSTLKPHEAAAYKVLHEYYNDPVMKKAYRTMRFMDWYQNASGNLKGVAPDVIQLTNGELVWGRIKKGKDSDSFVEINIGDGKDPNILKVKKKDIADDGVGSTLDRLAKILEKEHESGSTTFDLFHKELENTPGFLVSKNYAPEFSADTKLGFNVPMKEMSKGFLKSKQDGETSVRFDALNNFTRKVTADLKFMFLKNPVREMKDIYESGRLSQEANIEIAQTIDYLDRPFDASSLTAFERHLVGNIMKVSLTTLKAWTRNSLQRWTAMPYYSVADMPSFLLNTAKMTFNRGGMFNARKSSSFKKAPNKLKKYFLELVTNDHVLQEEFLHRYHTPWLDKGGIAGRFAKKAMDLYTGVDTTNRWVNFKNAYDVVSKHLNSNKSFGKIRKKIFWDFLPESLKDNLRHEIEAGNTDYVAMKIAESMTGRKWQYRYGRLERSMHEKSHKGAWFGRVTNYSRNYMLRNLDAGKRIFDGTTGMVKTIGRDHAQFKLHRQKTLQSTKELIGLYLVSSMLEETFKGITGKRGITGWNPINAMMGEIYPFVDTLSDLGTPLASLGSVSISLSHYLAGDMSKKEWEKSWQRDLRATIRAVDTMSLQQIMFYKWFVVGGLEIIYGKNGIKPLSDAINKGLNPEKWGRENVDRTELEMAQHLAFGKDYIESTRSYLKKKEKPVF
jgi:hypothetical protein